MSVTKTLKGYLIHVARLQRSTYVAALAPLSLVPTQTPFMLQSCLLAWKEQHVPWI